MRVLLIGKSSGRLDCLAEALRRSKWMELFILTNLSNPSLAQKGFITIGPTEDPNFVAHFAETIRGGTSMLGVISNEEPLAAGVTDALNAIGIPVIGPTQALAQIETSKSFTRRLMEKHGIVCNPHWHFFEPGEINRVETFMVAFGQFVIKPDGLTGGKGVRVMGDHFRTREEGLAYCQEIFDQGGTLLIEQKHEGQEFSLMSFSDGNTIVDMPVVQDHKRLLDGDIGPNTGGMGSYSDANHGLPVCSKFDVATASFYNRKAIETLQKEIGQPYKGIIYGNYMMTRRGLILIEFNARFGDPEVMNVLPLLETDFGDILFHIGRGSLKPSHVRFANKATVCKYLVPVGHPIEPKPGHIDTSRFQPDKFTRLYLGAVDDDRLTGSRAAAVVGIADDLFMAHCFAEHAAQQIDGPLFYRKDIGTYESLEKRIAQADHIRRFR